VLFEQTKKGENFDGKILTGKFGEKIWRENLAGNFWREIFLARKSRRENFGGKITVKKLTGSNI